MFLDRCILKYYGIVTTVCCLHVSVEGVFNQILNAGLFVGVLA